MATATIVATFGHLTNGLPALTRNRHTHCG